MITATRPGHYITRNISFFKKVLQQEIQHNSEDACDEDEDYSKLDNNLPDTNIEVNNELAEMRDCILRGTEDLSILLIQ